MIVRELIDKLSTLDPKLEVMITHDYGDRQHTTVASEVEAAEIGFVIWSDYHDQDKVTDEDLAEGVREVVLLGVGG